MMTTSNYEQQRLGDLLRQWRTARKLSQLELANRAETSSRHISFIETGRGRPSKGLLLRLADELEVPLRARNALLAAGGFTSRYRETGLTAPEMKQVLKTLQYISKGIEPYPVMIIDRYWNILMANQPMNRVVETFVNNQKLLKNPPFNLMKLVLHPDGFRPNIENLSEFEPYMASRAKRALNADPYDKVLSRLVEDAELYREEGGGKAFNHMESLPQVLMPIHLSKGGIKLKLFTSIAFLGAPQDITLQELRIESGFPVDEDSDHLLQQWGSDEYTSSVELGSLQAID